MTNTYEVEEVCLGEDKTNHITFRSQEDLKKAYEDLNNGTDIYVVNKGIVTLVPYQLLNVGVYIGKVELRAKQGGE